MVIVSSTLICGLLLAANYAEQKNGGSTNTSIEKTTCEEVDVLKPEYPGLVAGIPMVLFY